MLRDLTTCEHRVSLDLFGDATMRDLVSAFTAMLWDQGCDHEDAILSGLAAQAVDLRGRAPEEREAGTAAALYAGPGLILGARIRHDDMLGDPDLLRREDGRWSAGDVKSGGALEGGRPKKAYAAQVAHYAAILARLGAGDGLTAFIVDRDGTSVDYLLAERAGPRSPAPRDAHLELLARAREIRDGALTRPALSADCKGCHWNTACKIKLKADDDPTLVAELGRTARDALLAVAPTVAALAAMDPAALARGTSPAVTGVGRLRLARFAERAKLLREPAAGPYARAPLPLVRSPREFFLDVEADPLAGDVVYLHGVLERTSTADTSSERFHAFFADDPDRGERDAFEGVMTLLRSDPAAPVFVYSAYERTSFRNLQSRYQDVCAAEEIEALFDPSRTIDLLTAIVRPLTEWPVSDRSIKTLARLCGFEWRDTDPSGANSIEWYRTWQRTGDAAVRERIVRYNEDDVIATRVLLDALIALPVRMQDWAADLPGGPAGPSRRSAPSVPVRRGGLLGGAADVLF